MDEPVPAPPLTQRTAALMGIAALFAAVATGLALLPWRTPEDVTETELMKGYVFIEGILGLVLGGSTAVLFLAAFCVKSPTARGRLAGVAALLSFGVALAPLELYARHAWMGMRSVLILGVGYIGWLPALYAAMAAGFLSAAMGSVAAAQLLIPSRVTTVKVKRRRPPPDQGL
jgi:hypothetical protein